MVFPLEDFENFWDATIQYVEKLQREDKHVKPEYIVFNVKAENSIIRQHRVVKDIILPSGRVIRRPCVTLEKLNHQATIKTIKGRVVRNPYVLLEELNHKVITGTVKGTKMSKVPYVRLERLDANTAEFHEGSENRKSSTVCCQMEKKRS